MTPSRALHRIAAILAGDRPAPLKLVRIGYVVDAAIASRPRCKRRKPVATPAPTPDNLAAAREAREREQREDAAVRVRQEAAWLALTPEERAAIEDSVSPILRRHPWLFRAACLSRAEEVVNADV